MTVSLPMLDDKERLARCAWVCYLDDLVGGWEGLEGTQERRDETEATLGALPAELRTAHLAWRKSMREALEQVTQDHCPGHGDCCDATGWPDESPRPRATVAEQGYIESVGRLLASSAPRFRIRVLMAALIMQSAEEDVPPEALARELLLTAKVYQRRLALLLSPERYDGNGLIGYAFPKEAP